MTDLDRLLVVKPERRLGANGVQEAAADSFLAADFFPMAIDRGDVMFETLGVCVLAGDS